MIATIAMIGMITSQKYKDLYHDNNCDEDEEEEDDEDCRMALSCSLCNLCVSSGFPEEKN